MPSYDRATSVLTVPSVAVGTIAYGNARVRLGGDGRWPMPGAGGAIKGVAIFVWDITAATLTLLNPPEPLVSGRNNNYNYSLATPRWIP